MITEFQYELNREWLYDKKDEEIIIGEKNFVIRQEYLSDIFSELFPNEDFDTFIEWYVPETDGEKIYQRALKDHEVIEEFITYINEGDYLK